MNNEYIIHTFANKTNLLKKSDFTSWWPLAVVCDKLRSNKAEERNPGVLYSTEERNPDVLYSTEERNPGVLYSTETGVWCVLENTSGDRSGQDRRLRVNSRKNGLKFAGPSTQDISEILDFVLWQRYRRQIFLKSDNFGKVTFFVRTIFCTFWSDICQRIFFFKSSSVFNEDDILRTKTILGKWNN